MSEEIHREKFSYKVSRRGFFPVLLKQMLVLVSDVRGGRNYLISDLGDMPDEQLAEICPVVNEDFEILVEDGFVCSRNKRSGHVRQLFPVTLENTFVFNLFNGNHDLGDVAHRLAEEMDWDETRSFAFSREFFLSLAKYLVCVPGNSTD